MAIQLVSVKCPDCGANLHLESGRRQAFCTYCGAKVILHNTNEKNYLQARVPRLNNGSGVGEWPNYS